ncbi:MAG: BREX-6 system BrxE protein [Proteobacteria bacterium]|nr:BREX-6 system BrxE protein [Pseudomonadota bacterium]
MRAGTERKGGEPIPASHLDGALSAQLIVAWAGEGGEEPRLGWWRSDLCSEFGGEDLFKRLLPNTWQWAVLQGARQAAMRRDAELRSRTHDPDRLVSLFNFGVELDERIEERLLELKRRGASPAHSLPQIAELVGNRWRPSVLLDWIGSHGAPNYATGPTGRALEGAPPEALDQTVRRLVGALAPLADQYPLPHFQRVK